MDLLGGYKPFDSLLLLKQIYRDFCHEQNTNQYIEEVQVNSNRMNIVQRSVFSVEISSSKTIQRNDSIDD